MKYRSLLLAALLIAAAGAIVLLRRRPGVEAPTPSSARPSAPAAAAPTDSRKPALPVSRKKRVEPPVEIRLFSNVRGFLQARVAKVLEQEGPRAAYAMLLSELEKTPADLQGRVRRAYVLRFLPWLVQKDASLEAEVVRTLERHAGGDADPYARFVAVAALLDCSVFYTQPSPKDGYFFARIAQRLSADISGPDQGVLGLRRRDFPRLNSLLQELYGREQDRDNRQLLVELLADEKRPETVEFLSRVAANDADREVRYWSIVGLAEAPKSPGTLAALQRSAADADPRNRLSALNSLVRLGACDDLVVSRLLTTPEQSGALYQTIGEAYAASSAAPLGARLRESLAAADARTRRLALHGIVSSGSKEFLPDLEPALAREQDPALKRELETAMARLSGTLPPESHEDDDDPKR